MKKILLTLAMLCSFGSGALLAADKCCSKKSMECCEKKACCDDMNKKSCCSKKKMKKVKAANNNSMEADAPMKKVRKAKQMKSMSEVVATANQSAMQ
ncbi:MAG: hypothetical protein EBY16_09265 [Gammaproteobacteria bacterium]|nr:hypothetical protein [Gammaproteobacteria bacterium]